MSNIQKRNQEVTSSLSNGCHRDASFQRQTITTQIDEWIFTNQSPSYHHSSYTIEDRNQIRDALEDELGCHHHQPNDQCYDNSTVDINWSAVHALLLQLGRYTSVNQQLPSNYQEDDPFGRIFITHLLACNPPMNCLDAALRVFPDAVGPNNPVAFFTACSNASQQAITHMMQHVLQKHLPENEGNQHSFECPYPWILLPFISVEAAQIMLDMYPQGVWETSSTPFLTSDSCSYSPLDYILFSSAMTKRRDFDEAMWLKFKLILVTADKNYDNFSNGCEISPVHTLLDRVLACSDCLEDSERAQHILWLLQELRLSDEWVFQKQRLQLSKESLFPLHLLLSHKCIASSQPALVAARELCKIIIEADSLAVMHGISTDEALYPLHLAIENGWPCHDLLLSVWPESIEMPDPRTGLLPFQSASSPSPWPTPTWTNTTTSDMNLSIAFELLRANPTMAVSCATTDTAIMMESTPVAVASATVSGIA